LFARIIEALRDIRVITRKELLYVSRDPDVLIYTVLVPLVIYPIVFIGTNDIALWILGRFEQQSRQIAVDHVDDERYSIVVDSIKKHIKGTQIVEPPNAMAELRAGKVNAYVSFEGPKNVFVNVAQANPFEGTAIKVVSAIQSEKWDRREALEKQSGLSTSQLEVFDVQRLEIAPSQSKGGYMPVEKLGGLPLALMFLLCFVWVHVVIGMGPPATVMFAEQREKRTIETMLMEPVSRLAMVGAKFCTVWLIGMIAGVMYACGIGLTAGTLGAMALVKAHDYVPGAKHSTVLSVLPHVFDFSRVAAETWILLVVATLLNTGLCAVFYLLFASRAATFKQAQALITLPMLTLIILPMTAPIPGLELSWSTVFIPTLNLFLALKRGEPDLLLTIIAIVWNAALLMTALVLTRRMAFTEKLAA